MCKLSKKDKQQISTLVKKAEQSTRGEIVTVLAQSSGGYGFTCLLWSAFIAFLVPVLLDFTPLFHVYLDGSWNIRQMVLLQIFLFILSYIILFITPLKYCLTPRQHKHAKASKLAEQQFFSQGLHLTPDRAAILLFVSMKERYVRIIADEGIDKKVDDAVWQSLVEGFSRSVKAGDVKKAFTSTIKECGGLLKKHYPQKGKKKNYLEDVFIEL